MSLLNTTFYVMKANAETAMSLIGLAQASGLGYCVVGQLKMETRNEVTYRMMKLGWKVSWKSKHVISWLPAKSQLVTLMATDLDTTVPTGNGQMKHKTIREEKK